MAVDRKYFKSLRQRKLSVIFLHEVLSRAGIDVSKRTLQWWVDSDFLKCTDERVIQASKKVISNYDNLIKELQHGSI